MAGITVRDYIDKCNYVIAELPRETERILAANKDAVLDLNRQDQLYETGIDSNGRKLKSYRPNTVAIKAEKNQIFQYTTLKDTGLFYSGFDYLFRDNKLSIFSRDSKSSELQDKYGVSIFGLTTDNERILNYEILQPKINDFIKKYL